MIMAPCFVVNFQSFSIPSSPISASEAVVMNHTYHHRGQLSVYLRLLDVPVPAIYGPSADENPVAAQAQV
jgi:uncharacterized damage-inducible protein DinB